MRAGLRPLRVLAVDLMIVTTLPGCSLDQQLERSQQTIGVARAQMDRAREDFSSPGNSPGSQMVQKPWVSGKPVALAADVTLPEALRTPVKTTLVFAQKNATLQQVASRIALATTIPVRVMPDALLSGNFFLPRLHGVDGAQAAKQLTQQPMPSGTYALAKILDIIAAEHDVHWRYGRGGIEFYRTRTQVFDVRALTLAASTEMKLGRGGAAAAEGFQSSAQTALVLEREPVLQAIRHRLEPFLTRAGIVSAQPGSLTSIVVTDTPAALEAIAGYLESVNRSMSLRVRLVFEEMTVSQKQGQDQGLDWSVAFAKGLVAVGAGRQDGGSAGQTALKLDIFSPEQSHSANLTLRAVADYANVLRHTVVPVVTLNRRPVTHAVRSTFTYVDQVQALASSRREDAVTNQPGVAVSQKRETTGAFLTLVPDVQEDGQILLSVAYDNTVAMPLKALHFGNAQNSYQVQQLTIHGSGTVQQVALRPGRPVLIAGFEQREDDNAGSRMAPSLPRATGGYDKVGQARQMTLIFVTAYIEEGF